jgi:hypothetical protein
MLEKAFFLLLKVVLIGFDGVFSRFC